MSVESQFGSHLGASGRPTNKKGAGSLLFHKLEIGLWMRHKVDLNGSQSPAGQAPTILTSNVGARPAGDTPIRKNTTPPLLVESSDCRYSPIPLLLWIKSLSF